MRASTSEAPAETLRLLREASWLRGFALELMGDEAAADDVVQASVLSAVRSGVLRRGASHIRDLRGWFRTVARRHVWTTLRDDSRRTRREGDRARPEASVPAAVDALERIELQRRIAEAIQGLPALDRDIVALRHFDDLQPRQIAERLALRPSVVSTRLSRAHARLRRALEGDDPGLRRLCAVAGVAGGSRLDVPAAVGRPRPPRAANKAPKTGSATGSATGAVAGGMLLKKSVAMVAVVLVSLYAWQVVWRSESNERPALPGPAAESTSLARVDDVEKSRADAAAPISPAPSRRALARDPDARSVEEVAVEEPEPTGSLRVEVREAGSGRPAPNVGLELVRFGGFAYWDDVASAVTGADGVARFESERPGRVHVYCQRLGASGAMEAEAAEVVAGETARLTFEVDESRIVRGRVVDDAGRPVAEASIWLGDGSGAPSAGNVVAHSGADGSFVVPYAAPLQMLGARAAGHADSPLTAPGLLPEGRSEEPIELVVDRACGSVSGVVRDSEGVPVAGARVVVGAGSSRAAGAPGEGVFWGPPKRRLRTDAEGRFECGGLSLGAVEVSARARRTGLATRSVEVFLGSTTDVELRLGRTGTIEGVVTHADGRPAPGVTVSVVTHGDDLLTSSECRSDEEGRYVLQGVPCEPTELEVEDPTTRLRVTGVVRARPDTTVRWDASLPALLSLTGSLVLGTGETAAGWIVRAHAPGRDDDPLAQRYAKTDEQGRFVLAPSLDASYDVTIGSPGWLFGDAVHVVRGVRPEAGPHLLEVPARCVPRGSLGGTVEGPDGDPLVASVSVSCAAAGIAGISARSGADGVFEVSHLPPGHYTVHVSSNGHGSVSRERSLGAIEHGDLGSIRLSRQQP